MENVRGEAALESVRDALDRLGVDYEHVRSEPDDDRFFPDRLLLRTRRLGREYRVGTRGSLRRDGFGAEVL